jgi:hypothetical protein
MRRPVPQQNGNFESFGRIRLTKRPGAFNRLSLAPFQDMICHLFALLGFGNCALVSPQISNISAA